MTEQQIQKKITKNLESKGWMVVKLIKTTMNGIPDLLCLKGGTAIFVEVKKEDGILSPLQKERIKQIEEQGFTVKVWKGYNENY